MSTAVGPLSCGRASVFLLTTPPSSSEGWQRACHHCHGWTCSWREVKTWHHVAESVSEKLPGEGYWGRCHPVGWLMWEGPGHSGSCHSWAVGPGSFTKAGWTINGEEASSQYSSPTAQFLPEVPQHWSCELKYTLHSPGCSWSWCLIMAIKTLTRTQSFSRELQVLRLCLAGSSMVPVGLSWGGPGSWKFLKW